MGKILWYKTYRLAYASHSTFKPFVSASGMDVNIAQILEVARQNNQKIIWLELCIMAMVVFSMLRRF